MTDSRFPHAYGAVRAELLRRLADPPNYLVQIQAGPRQVGKTTLLLELEQQWPGGALHAAQERVATAAGVTAVSWPGFLLGGLPGGDSSHLHS